MDKKQFSHLIKHIFNNKLMIFQTMRNALIWATEDLGPIGNRFQQQTVDQEHHGKWYIISRVIKNIYFSHTIWHLTLLSPCS